MKKIAILTTTRAEYGLLSPLIRAMEASSEFCVEVIVSGTHLLKKYGETIEYIRKDGINVAHQIAIYDEDFISTEAETVKSIAKSMEGIVEVFENQHYDALIVLGDRYELLGFCIAAMLYRIPIIHLHGGEITEGAVDDKIRHAITKMASIHFPSLEVNAKRIVQMGENPEYVFSVGALGIDNIVNYDLICKEEMGRELCLPDDKKIAAVTFHPVTGEDKKYAAEEMEIVLGVLLEKDLFSVMTMPNSDVGGDEIYNVILKYCKNYPDNFSCHKSLGQKRYLSLLACADIMVGNSSSGIIESASFKIPTIDIGDRQKGRFAPQNVIHCACDREEINAAIDQGLSKEFKGNLKDYINPYGAGNTAEKIAGILTKMDLHDISLIQKTFYNLDWDGYYGEK